MHGVSVIVCCYNSKLRLAETIRYLANQQVPENLSWEIIIIDNASSDNTSEVAYEAWAKYFVPNVDFRVLTEQKPGLSYAREKGILSSRYNYNIFCDDDNLLAPDYVIQAEILLNKYPEFGIIGGNNKYGSGFENFIVKNYISDYAVGDQATDEMTDLTDNRGFVWGGGMAIRKLVFNDLKQNNFISLLSDRKGTQLTSGGDAEICLAARLLGWKIGASSFLNLIHNVPENRFTLTYLINLKKGFGRSDPFLNIYQIAWLHKKDKNYIYSYKRELFTHLRTLLHYKRPLLLYFIGLKKCRKDFIELNFIIAKIKTLISNRIKLNKALLKLINNDND